MAMVEHAVVVNKVVVRVRAGVQPLSRHLDVLGGHGHFKQAQHAACNAREWKLTLGGFGARRVRQ